MSTKSNIQHTPAKEERRLQQISCRSMLPRTTHCGDAVKHRWWKARWSNSQLQTKIMCMDLIVSRNPVVLDALFVYFCVSQTWTATEAENPGSRVAICCDCARRHQKPSNSAGMCSMWGAHHRRHEETPFPWIVWDILCKEIWWKALSASEFRTGSNLNLVVLFILYCSKCALLILYWLRTINFCKLGLSGNNIAWCSCCCWKSM